MAYDGRRSDGERRRYDNRKPYGTRLDEGREYGKKREDKPYDRPYEKKQYGSRQYDNKYDKYDKNDKNDKKPYENKSYDKRYDKKPYDKKPYEKYDKRQENRAAEEYTGRSEQREQPVNEPDELPYIIMGRNAVREAVRSGRSIDRILVSKEPDGSLREIINLARDNGVQVREVERGKLDEMCLPFGHGGKTGNHQGIVAQVPGVEYCEISDILKAAREKDEKPFIILLDGIEDPHNLGSIIRSAECAGAHGVVIPKRRCASVTAAASKASAGAVEYMKVARVSNLAGAIDRLKDEGLWIAGADMSGTEMAKTDLKGAVGLVIGNEGDGLSRLVREKCDFLVSIPMWGHIDSLNAAVSAAILMYEKKRQG